MTDAKSWIWNGIIPCINTSWGVTCLGIPCAEKEVRSSSMCHGYQQEHRARELLYPALIRSDLESGDQFWPPQYKKDEGKLKWVQNRVTKVVSGLEYLTYERLTEQGLFTLENRRLQRTSQQSSHIDKEFTGKTEEAGALVRRTCYKLKGGFNWKWGK